MTVKEFIEYLKECPQDIQVGYRLFSEQCLLELEDIELKKGIAEREDGWIHDERPDKPAQLYLILPGN